MRRCRAIVGDKRSDNLSLDEPSIVVDIMDPQQRPAGNQAMEAARNRRRIEARLLRTGGKTLPISRQHALHRSGLGVADRPSWCGRVGCEVFTDGAGCRSRTARARRRRWQRERWPGR